MHKYVRHGLAGSVAAAVAAVAFAAPAQAATNPYTPQEACNHQFGGSWSQVSDGHRNAVTLDTGAKWGDVYLMYNSSTGFNCVAAMKSVYLGTKTSTAARLLVQGSSTWHVDAGQFAYYAAVEAAATDRCVQYDGYTYSADMQHVALAGRYTWGNCG